MRTRQSSVAPGGSTAATARLRARYPRSRLPRALVVAGATAVAVAFVTWLVWTATFHANPPVTGQVSSFLVRSDTRIAVTLTVERPDPSIPATCRVIAQATDYQLVAEQTVALPPAQAKRLQVDLTLITLRRATSASVRGCTI